jgi:L-threonylcarbamoyladenylate synthase
MPILPATAEAIAEAVRRLAQGEFVAFPTETVYGLGADATNGRAVAAIFAAKGRPAFNPLIVHVPSLAEAERLGVFDATARKISETQWPGPLTLVVRKAEDCAIADLATAGLDTIAIRVPSHPVARALLAAFGRPVAAPSANPSGGVSPTTAAHVSADFGTSILVIDGGAAAVGLESTIVDMTNGEPILLRPGGVTREALERTLGRSIVVGGGSETRPNAPGQLASHYAPSARVRLNARDTGPGEALLAFGPRVPQHNGPARNLSVSGDLIEAAANLFADLRALDQTGANTIAVMPIPEAGLGIAINDRLQRAAAPR